MKLLALDTATERIALALSIGSASSVRNLPGGAASSAELIPQVLALLQGQGLRLSDLDAIAFGQGPGAFTGLRTAVSVAQGLAFGAGKPVLAIDSLMIVADDARAQWRTERDEADLAEPPFDIWVAMDARMDQVYAAAYRHAGRDASNGDRWQVLRAPALLEVAALQELWEGEPPSHVAGSALLAFPGRLRPGSAACWPTQQDRAAALLRLSCAAWRDGAVLPAQQALPLYLRDKVAQTTAERAAAREREARSAPG